MKSELKQFVWIIGLGMALTAFAFQNFATKGTVRDIHDSIEDVEERLDTIYEHLLAKPYKRENRR